VQILTRTGGDGKDFHDQPEGRRALWASAGE